jgi:hypothetical protein
MRVVCGWASVRLAVVAPPILPDMNGVISGDLEDFWIGGHISGV